ncbi:MAG: ubiquinone/menaquinone biosynthesis methyltransferase [bacterium]
MFGSISGRYDLLNRVLSGGWDRSWRRRAVAAVAEAAPARVIDIGTGTADLALDLLRVSGFRGSVVGVDFAGPMLVRAAGKSLGQPRVHLAQCDALALPFRDAAFDAAMAAFSVRNFADLDRGLFECRRVIRRGGTLVILEFFRPERLPFPLRLYSRWFVPAIGRVVSGHATAYSYLPDSQESFVSIASATETLLRNGFAVRRVDRLFPGVAHLLVLDRL